MALSARGDGPTALAVQSANSVATVGTANAWPLTPPTFDTSLPRRALINGPLVVLGNYQNGNDNQNGDSNQQTSNSNTNLTGNGSSVISNANGATTDMSHSNNQQLNQGQQDQRSSHRETQAPLRNLTGEQDSQPQTVEETPAVPAVRPLPPPSPQQQQPATPLARSQSELEHSLSLMLHNRRPATSKTPKMQSRSRKQARLSNKVCSRRTLGRVNKTPWLAPLLPMELRLQRSSTAACQATSNKSIRRSSNDDRDRARCHWPQQSRRPLKSFRVCCRTASPRLALCR